MITQCFKPPASSQVYTLPPQLGFCSLGYFRSVIREVLSEEMTPDHILQMEKMPALGRAKGKPAFIVWKPATMSPLELGLGNYWPLTLTGSPRTPGPMPAFRQCQASIQQRQLIIFDCFPFLATSVEGYANKKIS